MTIAIQLLGIRHNRFVRALTVAVGFGLLSVVCAVLLHRGGIQALVLPGLIVGAGLVALVLDLGFKALLFWVVATPIAYPFLRYPDQGGLVTFDRLWIGAMIGLVLLQPRAVPRSGPSRLFVLGALGFLVVYLGHVYVSDLTLYGVRIWIDSLFLPFVLFLVASRFATSMERAIQLAGALTLAGVIMAMVGLAGKMLGFELASRTGGTLQGVAAATADVGSGAFRLTGPYTNGPMYAMSLLVCLAAALLWVQARGRERWLPGNAAIAVILLAITFSFFRAAWIGAFLVIVAAIGIRPGRFHRAVVVAVILGLAALVLSAPLQSSEEFTSRATNADNVSIRFSTWLTGIELFTRHPLFGVGFTRFTEAKKEVDDPIEVAGITSDPFPHSSFNAVLAEQGLVGIIPFLLIAIAVLRIARSLGRSAREREDVLVYSCVVGAAFAYLVMSTSLTMLAESAATAFFAVLLGVASARLDVVQHLSGSPGGQHARTDTG
jgi:O-antigen ligase